MGGTAQRPEAYRTLEREADALQAVLASGAVPPGASIAGAPLPPPPPPPPLATAALRSAGPSGADDLTLMIERIKAQGTEQMVRPWGGDAP